MVAAAFSTLITMETEEAQIAQGLRRRDPDVLDALIEQYQHRLLRYLAHMTHNQTTAEDLFQETWIRVLEKGHQYDGKSRFSTWLMTIAHNVAVDHLRKKVPHSLDEMRETEDAVPFEPIATDRSPFEHAAAREDRERIQKALEEIPTIFREVLVLRFQEQLKLEEIAKLVGIPLATVKTRLYRGVIALRPALGGGAQ